MVSEELYPLYVAFIRGFREANPEVACEFPPASFEVFDFIIKQWNQTLNEKIKALIVKQWRNGWQSVPDEGKHNVVLWKRDRCIAPQ